MPESNQEKNSSFSENFLKVFLDRIFNKRNLLKNLPKRQSRNRRYLNANQLAKLNESFKNLLSLTDHNIEQKLIDVREKENLQDASLQTLEIVKCIIYIRRGIRPRRNFRRFKRLIWQDWDRTRKDLNSRWLISLLDTYSDWGNSKERRNAYAGVSFLNGVRFTESEHFYRTGPEHFDAEFLKQYDFKKYRGKFIWDGIKVMNPSADTAGACMTTWLERTIDLQRNTPEVMTIFLEVLKRMLEDDSCPIGRFRKTFGAQFDQALDRIKK